jgi:hypothetical protein
VSRNNKENWEYLQRLILTQFLAKPGAQKAKLGVFGHFGANGAIYFAF